MHPIVQHLVETRYLKTPRIIRAFEEIERANFMRKEDRAHAEVNEAFPIGYEQTISQPLTVAFMLELLAPHPGDKLLDIGAGSGWQAALLGHIVGPKGRVYSIEVIPEVFVFGRENLKQYGPGNIVLRMGDGSIGWDEQAPFDGIIAAASAESVPPPLKEQLKTGGRLVIPVKDAIVRVTKQAPGKFLEETYPYFSFVPMRGRWGQKKS